MNSIIFETVWIKMLKNIYILFISSLYLFDFFSSLSSFITFFLLSLSFSSFFLRHSLFSVNSLPFLFFSLLQSPKSSPLPSFLFLFISFFPFFCHSAPLCLFFFSLSHSLFLLFSLPRPLPLRLAIAVEFGLTDEVNWWRSHLSLGFFFFGCGFHVIVGGGGVRLIPCDLGCINGVDSSHFF